MSGFEWNKAIQKMATIKVKEKRERAYSEMEKPALVSTAMELVEVAEAMLEYIDALPSDIELPAMPGFDRDWVESVLDYRSDME